MSETLAAPAAFTLEVKHSRFLAQAAPVATPADAMPLLERLADPAATHNCWAYRVGGDYRSSDDGEPAGTAGRPILAAIDGQGCDQVLVVVTRWYGGTKLGAGGLVRAYGGAAAECLRGAARLPLVVRCELEVGVGFDDIGTVHAALADFGADKLGERFAPDGVHLRLSLPRDRAGALRAHLRDATRNRATIRG